MNGPPHRPAAHRSGRSRPGRVGLSVGLLLVALVWLSGCRSRERLPVRKVLVDVEASVPGDVAGLARDQLRAQVEAFVDAEPRFERVSADAREAGVLRVRLEAFGRMVDAGKGPVAHLSLVVQVTGASDGEPYELRAQSFVTAAAGVDAGGLFADALSRCATPLIEAYRARGESLEVLAGWLGDPAQSKTRRLEAARLLGARGHRGALPALVALLRDADEELALTALGALTRLGDPSALDAVVAFAEGKPSPVRRQAIEAIRAMGTRRGMAWLFTLSSGHPDAAVRTSATKALGELEAKAGLEDQGAGTAGGGAVSGAVPPGAGDVH